MTKEEKTKKEKLDLESLVKKLSKKDLENVIDLAEAQLTKKRLHKGNVKRMKELKDLIGDNKYFIFNQDDMIKISDIDAFNLYRINSIGNDGLMNITRIFIDKIPSTGIITAEKSEYDLELTSVKTYDHIKNYWKAIVDDSFDHTFTELEKRFSQRESYLKNLYDEIYRIGKQVLDNIE